MVTNKTGKKIKRQKRLQNKYINKGRASVHKTEVSMGKEKKTHLIGDIK